jgi:hypothetical protein
MFFSLSSIKVKITIITKNSNHNNSLYSRPYIFRPENHGKDFSAGRRE